MIFSAKNIDSLPVVRNDDHHELIGLLNRREAIAFYNQKIEKLKSDAATNEEGAQDDE